MVTAAPLLCPRCHGRVRETDYPGEFGCICGWRWHGAGLPLLPVVPPPPTEKSCNKCGRKLPMAEYAFSGLPGGDGHRGTCRGCQKESDRDRNRQKREEATRA